MAVNKPYNDGRRYGSVRNRTQTYNSQTGLYVKRDKNTGKFMNVKTTGGKFKGVRKEK